MAKKTWIEAGDVNFLEYGGVWYRRLSGTATYHFIRLDNMDECCGRDNEGRDTYNIILSDVDLSRLTAKQKKDIAESFDKDVLDCDDETLAHGAHGDGLYALLSQTGGNNGNKLIASMKALSRELENDVAAYKERLRRPVNAIGSTAEELAQGDILSALKRGIRPRRKKNPHAIILAKAYLASGGQTLGGERIPIEKIPGIWEL